MQLWYDVVPHHDGWAISITPSRHGAFADKRDSFPTQKAAFDIAVELARKLRFSGLSVHVRIDHEADDRIEHRKAS
jgi:Uncharacterized protein conserved in bacteria (DUF2188)